MLGHLIRRELDLTAAPHRVPLSRALMRVGTGVAVSGAATYGFLILSARALGVDGYADFAVAWSLVLIIGAGVFVPLEQETARVVAARRATGGDPWGTALGMARTALVLTAGCVVLVVAATPVLLPLVGDDGAVLVSVIAVAAVTGVPFLLRGVLSGEERFRTYAAVAAAESVLRFAGAALLLVAGIEAAAAAVAVVAAAALLSAAVATPALRGRATWSLRHTPASSWRPVLQLVGAALVAQALLNAAPVLVAVLAEPGEEVAAAQLLAGLVLVRVPLFLFSAVQATLVPRLSAAAAAGNVEVAGHVTRRLVLLVCAVTVAAATSCLLAGEPAVRRLFGPDFALGGDHLALLSSGVGCYLVAATSAAALLALDRHGQVIVGWTTGLLAMALATVVIGDLLVRIEAGFVVGSLAAAITLTSTLSVTVRRHATAGARAGLTTEGGTHGRN